MVGVIRSQTGDDVIPFEIEKRNRWNKVKWLPPNEILCAIFGKSGSGKTFFLLQIIPHIAPELLKHVIICSRIVGNEVYDAIQSWCKKNKIEYHFCNEVDDAKDTISEVINIKDDEDHMLIIMDDFNEGTITSKSNQYTKLTLDVFSKLRNYRAHMLFVVQNYTSVPVVCRSNLNVIVSFNIGDRWSKDILTKDLSSMLSIEMPEMKKMMDDIFIKLSKVKHSYMLATQPDTLMWYIHGITPVMQPYRKNKITN